MPELENWDGASDFFEEVEFDEEWMIDSDCDKEKRLDIAEYLRSSNLIGSKPDYLKIAEILEQGYSWEVVLLMAELERWPEAYEMLDEIAGFCERTGFDKVSVSTVKAKAGRRLLISTINNLPEAAKAR